MSDLAQFAAAVARWDLVQCELGRGAEDAAFRLIEEARAIYAELGARPNASVFYVDAAVLALTGKHREALGALNASSRDHDSYWFERDLAFRSLRGYPEFQRIVQENVERNGFRRYSKRRVDP